MGCCTGRSTGSGGYRERQQLRKAAEVAYRKATPTRQGRMSAEQKARVAGAHDFLIFITSEIGER